MLQVTHANLRKGPEIQLSFLNDMTLASHDLLLISEPYIVYSPHGRSTHTHNKWRAILPTDDRIDSEDTRLTRAMIWVKKEQQAIQQIEVQSTDITAIVLPIKDRWLLAIAAYVPPAKGHRGQRQLTRTTNTLREVIEAQQRQYGLKLDILIGGDFNRHDQLWGGDHIMNSHRQGEAQPIVELLIDHDLQSLLPRGTITYESSRWQSTIDLLIASGNLVTSMTMCQCHPVNHGSDHRAIQATFTTRQAGSTGTTHNPRFLWKQAPYDDINKRLQAKILDLGDIQDPTALETQLELLITNVIQGIESCTPRARPSPYCKRR